LNRPLPTLDGAPFEEHPLKNSLIWRTPMPADSVDDRPELSSLLPAEIRGWRAQGRDELYDGDTLYDLIDGGAEVYRALRVRQVLSRRYRREGFAEILADLFDMGSAADAFGAYHHDMREGEDAGVGAESEFLGSALSFWKGRFFVSLIALDQGEEIEAALRGLARAVAEAIPGTTAFPALVNRLPGQGLCRDRIHYFHDKMLLDRHYFLSEKNLLGLSDRTEGVLARYRLEGGPLDKEGDARPALLLVQYPGAEEAARALDRFLKEYLPNADEEGTARREDGRFAGAARKGALFAAVLDAPSRDVVRRLIADVKEETREGGRSHEDEKE